MSFPQGKILLLVFLMAMVGAAGLLLHSPSRLARNQTLWVFDSSHADTYRFPTDRGEALTHLYTKATGRTVNVELIPSRVLDARLLCLILGNIHSHEVPDVVEIEIGYFMGVDIAKDQAQQPGIEHAGGDQLDVDGSSGGFRV